MPIFVKNVDRKEVEFEFILINFCAKKAKWQRSVPDIKLLINMRLFE